LIPFKTTKVHHYSNVAVIQRKEYNIFAQKKPKGFDEYQNWKWMYSEKVDFSMEK